MKTCILILVLIHTPLLFAQSETCNVNNIKDFRVAVISQNCRGIDVVNQWAKQEQSSIGTEVQFKPENERVWALVAMTFCKKTLDNDCKLEKSPSIADIKTSLNISNESEQALEMIWNAIDYIPPITDKSNDYFQKHFRNEISLRFSALNKLDFDATDLKYEIAHFFLTILPFNKLCKLQKLQQDLPDAIKKISSDNKNKIKKLVESVYQKDCPIEENNVSNNKYITWIKNNDRKISQNDIDKITTLLNNSINKLCTNNNNLNNCLKKISPQRTTQKLTDQQKEIACKLTDELKLFDQTSGFAQDIQTIYNIQLDNNINSPNNCQSQTTTEGTPQ